VYCVICLNEIQMYLNEYNKVKSSTVTVGYNVGVIDMTKVHRVLKKPLRGQSNQWD